MKSQENRKQKLDRTTGAAGSQNTHLSTLGLVLDYVKHFRKRPRRFVVFTFYNHMTQLDSDVIIM